MTTMAQDSKYGSNSLYVKLKVTTRQIELCIAAYESRYAPDMHEVFINAL